MIRIYKGKEARHNNNTSQKTLLDEEQVKYEKMKQIFHKEAKELGVDINKLNCIIKDGEVLHNPYKYNKTNRWTQKFRKL